jgi:hypothetical protein
MPRHVGGRSAEPEIGWEGPDTLTAWKTVRVRPMTLVPAPNGLELP